MTQQPSTFKIAITIPRQVLIQEDLAKVETLDRDDFFGWLWNRFESEGLVGVHEGTLLCDQAVTEGLEVDSWTVDSAEAPRERDWIGHLDSTTAELYFSKYSEASSAGQVLSRFPNLSVGPVQEEKSQDWDAEWKAAFLNSGEGVVISPFWRIVPPWKSESQAGQIKINPGAGFGTGTHETTQLCLQAIGELSGGPHKPSVLSNQKVLDFGCGSGILSIGMALLGAEVEAIEIDPLALDNALDNAKLNGVERQILFSRSFLSPSSYNLIVANILRPVLLEYSIPLTKRLQPEAPLILSGLIDTDLKEVIQEYSHLLKRPVRKIYEKGEWRAILF